jgi:hypothetical protein
VPIPKREPVSDIDTAVVDSLKVLDPNRPIGEADITPVAGADHKSAAIGRKFAGGAQPASLVS